ncbi:hypothetical protein M514_10534 [Trichuris suis]|uniref:Chitin-binding type-2 domain-containing protein n=1 Tax=Trichuris suis TaxID=68888 RepID=A0A085N3E5_9BILA|nr:hypothetical protein M514_10534 [Trichuris suis]
MLQEDADLLFLTALLDCENIRLLDCFFEFVLSRNEAVHKTAGYSCRKMELKLPIALTTLGCLLNIVFGRHAESSLCDPREYAKAMPDDQSRFFQCVNVVAHVGEWAIRKCPPGFVFEATKQRCKSAEAVRRQQSLCQLDPSAVGCPQVSVCPTLMTNPVAGGNCHWSTAGLAPVPGMSNSFLQCIPTTPDDLQICVTVNMQNTCHQTSGNIAYPICPCGPNNLCPGSASCYSGVCCAVVIVFPVVQPTILPTLPPRPLPICPNGMAAVCFCQLSSQCPPGYVCLAGGCCPQVTPKPLPICPNGQTAVSLCYGVGQSNCPVNYECFNGGCCPVPLPVCPDGVQAIQLCSDDMSCPAGYGCFNRGCCKLIICPTGVASSQYCQGVGQSTCPAGMTCLNGGCCPLPTCPSGQSALQFCLGEGSAGCPPGYVCYNGGCCQLPVCPGGLSCVSFCEIGGSCPPGYTCMSGGCCPLPTCSSGQPAASLCVLSSDCPSGFQCENGGCCPIPLPLCPTGQQATGPCSGPGSCTAGFFCYLNAAGQQGCCPIPVCPNGQFSLQLCDSANPCPGGYECINSGCCPIPLPTCPNGQQAIRLCNSNEQCPAEYSCMNGGCCPSPVPTCPNGQPALCTCGAGKPCPLGYNCINGGCCPAPAPVCPGGQVAVSACYGGAQCPSGFICLNGACCPTPLVVCPDGKQPLQQCDPYGGCPLGFFCISGHCCERPHVTVPPTTVCPVLMIPICLCAQINFVCPLSSICTSGYCCAPASSTSFSMLAPGSSCQASSQCAGYPMMSQCKQSRCTCMEGARSNGLRCVQFGLSTNVKNICDQFGTSCKKYFYAKTMRRKAITEEIGITNATQPLWWETIENYCATDRDCTPDKTCVREKCYKLLKPGEYGCELNEQCNRTLEETFCFHTKNSPIGYCRCAKRLYGFEFRCWKRCPQGTIASGDTCLLQRDLRNKSSLQDLVKKITLVFYQSDNSSAVSSALQSTMADIPIEAHYTE